MGVVYAAYDPKLDRRVALKLLWSTDAGARERILAEARALARLSDPHVRHRARDRRARPTAVRGDGVRPGPLAAGRDGGGLPVTR